ncbi:MAG: hypothetical protein LH650_08100, partial [Chloroflexi bacterium]|nr:hypothetical protein [Chloroflexota bacterium]
FNVTWHDQPLVLKMGPAWGLPPGDDWQVVRRFPDAAILAAPNAAGPQTIWMRPFEVLLLEIRPRTAASRDVAPLPVAAWPGRHGEPSVPLPVSLTADTLATPALVPLDALGGVALTAAGADLPRSVVRLSTTLPSSALGGMAVVWVRISMGDRQLPLDDAGAHFAATAYLDGSPIRLTPVVRDRTYSVPWQAWRIQMPAHTGDRALHLQVTAAVPVAARLDPGGAFVPNG